MEEYNPKPLVIEPSPQIVALGPRIEDKKLVFVIGAGVSMGPPTCLPSGAELANSVKTRLLDSPLASVIKVIAEDNLLAMADVVEEKSPAAFPLFVRAIFESADFKMATPNYAHLAIALLMTETNVQALSTNWDMCIEQSSPNVYSDIVGCFDLNTVMNAGDSTILLKLHGCAKNELSLCVSSRQIAKETWWATHQVGAAIERSLVVFLGIGSVAEYIKLTLQKILSMTSDLSNVLIVDPVLSDDWNSLMAGGVKNHLPIKSEEFLDDVLRTLTLSQLSRVNLLAQDMSKELPRSDIDIEVAVHETVEFFRKFPAHYIWLWVRRGFFSTGQNPSILDPIFKQFVLALALINCVSPLYDMDVIGNTSFIRCRDFVVELAWARDPVASRKLCRRKITSLKTDKRKNLLPQVQHFIILVHGFVGVLPSPIMKESVVDEPYLADIIDGSEALGAKWVNLAELIQTGERDKICKLLGANVDD